VARQPSTTGETVTRAASELMAARGYHGTSMRDVAKAVGIQMASLYYYHASKQELLVHLMRTTLEDLRRSVEEAMEGAGPDPIDQLDAGLRAHIAFHVERRDDVIITDSELRREPPHDPRPPRPVPEPRARGHPARGRAR
jgi:AcrR family transcriptional regulator